MRDGSDDLGWLEAPRESRALEWAMLRTEQSVRSLECLPLSREIAQELECTLRAAPAAPRILLLGARAVRFLVTAEAPFGRLQVARRDPSGVPSTWRTVLDIGVLRRQSGIAYELNTWRLRNAFLPDHDSCLLRLSHGGSDETEIMELDLETGAFVPGGFHVPRSMAWVQWLNPDLVLIGHTVSAEAPRTSGGPAAFHLWRRGQSLASAQVIYRAEPTDVLVMLDAAGSGSERYAVIVRTREYSRYEINLVYQDGEVRRVPFPDDSVKSAIMTAALAAGSRALFVQLTRNVDIEGRRIPASSIVSFAVDRSVSTARQISIVCTLGPEEFLAGPVDDGAMVVVGDRLVFTTNHRLLQVVREAAVIADGWSVRELMRLGPGEAVAGATADSQSGDLIVTTSGFLAPARQILHRSGGRPPQVIAQDPERFDASTYVIEIRAAESRDGTEIDYFLLRPRESRWSAAQPSLLTGYAGYGMSFPVTYFGDFLGGPALMSWLARGGSVVIPAARGGGERGEAWYLAAVREKRQTSYDDFIAVVRRLIDTGYTAPERLGVFGMSNGGLLAAVLGTQRPELFGAIVSDVPLTDLIRMKHMGKGATWLGEFGDPADPAMRKVLESYSPLQNVRHGARYPPFFISTSTEDDRTGPGHARKLAARLEAVGARVYLYEDSHGGHSVSDAYRHPRMMVLRMTFLIDLLMR
jgi:prolyl oligopeptidase